MKAPRQPQPVTLFPRTPNRQPIGGSQLQVDKSARQDAQREYLGRLQADAREGGPPAHLRSGLETLSGDDNSALERGADTKGLQIAPPAQLGKANNTTNSKNKTKGVRKYRKKRKVPSYRRFKTAYGVTTGTGNQGPHTVPHIGKKLAVENAYKRNKHFNIDSIKVRTGLIPSAGQNRKLIRKFEKSTNSKIPKASKVKLDKDYQKLLGIKENGTKEQRANATLKLFELNALGTYSLHQPASRSELNGKGERRTTVEPDLIKMSKMVKGGKAPKFSKVDNPKKPQHRKEDMEKLYRDMGKLYKGENDHSDMELSSDDEY